MELLRTYVEESPNISFQAFNYLQALSKGCNKGVRYTYNKNFIISGVYFVSPANSGAVSPLRHHIIHPNSFPHSSSYHEDIVWDKEIILETTQKITIGFKLQTCIWDMPDSNLDRDTDYPVLRSHLQSIQTNGGTVPRLGQLNAGHIPLSSSYADGS